jgi:glycosyltransferase involved in cell wall biosynthesis
MRILHCIPTLEPGGAERQLCYLTAGLVGLGHAVDVAMLSDGAFGDRLRASGATIHCLGARPAFDVTLIATLGALMRRRRTDVVQTWLRRMDVTAGLAALATGRPFVYSERTVWKPAGWRQRVRREVIARAAAVIANSQNAARFWRGAFGARKPVHVVPNALPLEEIAAAQVASRRAWQIAEDAELILFVGRFVPAKNVERLADALAIVLGHRPGAVALCCGDGELWSTFRQAVARRGLASRCRAPGHRADVWPLMKAADVLVSPSLHEGSPNAVLEAIACGCPVALSDIPAHRELAGGDAAFYFPATSAEAMAQAITRALDDPGEAERRARRAARAIAGTRSIETLAKAYTTIYADVAR